MPTPTRILDRVKVREVAGVFRARDAMDEAVTALLSSGFDRADIDVVVGAEARERLGGAKIAAEELPDVPTASRRPVIAREDVILVWSLVLSILIFAGAGFAAWLVVKSGGELIWAGIAAAIGAVAAGWLGAQLARAFARKRIRYIEAQLLTRELVLLVRVRSAEEEAKATEILLDHGAQAVRPHEIKIDKRLEDLPLHSLRVDPWLSDEPLAAVRGAIGGTRPGGLNNP
jgi:signal transduction histidine kinase